MAQERVERAGDFLRLRWTSFPSALAKLPEISRSELAPTIWGNSIATNCSQQLYPLAYRSALWCLRVYANMDRSIKVRIYVKQLAAFIMGMASERVGWLAHNNSIPFGGRIFKPILDKSDMIVIVLFQPR
jgi:hypothetical protein